jgi:hypothetical protein
MDEFFCFSFLEKDKQLACTHAFLMLLLPRQYGNADQEKVRGVCPLFLTRHDKAPFFILELVGG